MAVLAARKDGNGSLAVGENVHSSVEKVRRREVSAKLTLVLFVKSGGRCERRGCNKTLIEQPVSRRPGNFADKAHIVAFREAGPRGRDGRRPQNIDVLDNLMLLCKDCHKEIDDEPERYSRAVLEQMKREHERRVRTLLDLAPENSSHIITFTAPIGGFQVSIPRGDAFDAMLPRHPVEGNVTRIDMRDLAGVEEDQAFLVVGQRLINRAVEQALQGGGPVENAGHVSVFAIGPIPLLAYLGARLGDKIPVDLYQRHRDTEDWRWKSEDDYTEVDFTMSRQVDRGDAAPPGIIFSLSGRIDMNSLPRDIRQSHTLYEISLVGQVPSPTFLNCRRDLVRFREFWHTAQSEIAGIHGNEQPIAVFPAIPAPIAVALGKDRLPKARAPLQIYDNNVANGGFTFQMEISL